MKLLLLWFMGSLALLFGSFMVAQATFRRLDWEVDPPKSWAESMRRSSVTGARAKRVLNQYRTSGQHPKLLRANKWAGRTAGIAFVSLLAWIICMAALTITLRH